MKDQKPFTVLVEGLLRWDDTLNNWGRVSLVIRNMHFGVVKWGYVPRSGFYGLMFIPLTFKKIDLSWLIELHVPLF